ncbi:MAG TPA: cytochrome c [Solirubrobacterales bacterium]|nr:cytochrome c [Solirubrobacterales bacterium]
MTGTKIPKTAILIAILALAGVLAIAGCGGGGGTTSSEQGAAAGKEPNAPKETEEAPSEEPAEETEEAPAEEEAPEESEEKQEAGGQEAGGAESSLSAEGKTVFTSNCGSCHTLQAAGTSGTVGPNLDELEPNLETVEHQVVNGGGPMPAFGKEGILNAKEVKAVATYVSAVAGKG